MMNLMTHYIKLLGIGFFGVVVSFAIGNIFGDRFSHYPLSAYFYVYLAISLRALILTREKKSCPLV